MCIFEDHGKAREIMKKAAGNKAGGMKAVGQSAAAGKVGPNDTVAKKMQEVTIFLTLSIFSHLLAQYLLFGKITYKPYHIL